MSHNISSSELRRQILAKLSHNFGTDASEATNEQYYKALALIVNDILIKKRKHFVKSAQAQSNKKIYYLCMEFLMGRSLKNNLYNLGIDETARQALKQLGIDLEDIYEEEPDAGLGNGGLGRLAACFLDALATQGYPATGYSLRYEYGIFSQKLVDGWQTEFPDFWLPGGQIWLESHPEQKVAVNFNGDLHECWKYGYHEVNLKNATKVLAIPHDMYIAGYGGNGVSKLRLWSSESAEFDMGLFNSGNYMRAMEQDAMAETITKVLYPEDNHAEGKSLRLSQQYFLVSATIQDIIFSHLRVYRTLDNLPDFAAIHLNDTHPVLAIPELMRILLDECGYRWEAAWDIVTRTVAYTNHTVMAEALECWSQDMLKSRLPRIYQIVEEINRRFCAQMHEMGIDGYQVGRMAILNDGVVKMANLAIATCHSINGVSALHSGILKERVFKDFYTAMPEKFKNVTNGIAHRRWLNQSNPELAKLITELIGEKYTEDASQLKNLLKFKADNAVLERLAQIKRKNKERMAKYIKQHNGIIVDPDSIFDVHIKRLHEYKRQHLNALHILAVYKWLKQNPGAPFVPKTYIFGAKAAPGYYFAKQIIRFIVKLAETINNDPDVNQKIKVVFLEDYRVTVAEQLIPAAEVSQQISLAGTEASGTSNMKFMINGAITLGTLDGANVEICEAVGEENMILFGMTTPEVNNLKRAGYNPTTIYNSRPLIKDLLDTVKAGFGGLRFDEIADSLINSDPYMVLADLADFTKARNTASNLYEKPLEWNKMSLVNIANAGIFAADRSIRDYATDIWGTKPSKTV